MTDNLAIWTKLSKTDPNHTKGFNRSGGFKGTAVKPIYCTQRMTDHFGPCGVGWGINEPRFEVVRAENEILVYCTVSIWHGSRENVIYGVGGDKCVAARKDGGSFTDDEAFKKAFTDAIGNAMKQLGMSADIHMGLFDDAKYVNDLREEFAEKQPAKEATPLQKEFESEWEMIASAATLGDLSLIRKRITPKGALLDQVFADDKDAAFRIRDFLKHRTEELSQAPDRPLKDQRAA